MCPLTGDGAKNHLLVEHNGRTVKKYCHYPLRDSLPVYLLLTALAPTRRLLDK